MGRKHLIRSDYFPYHSYNRCNNREWFKVPLDVVWNVTTFELYRISVIYEAKIHAFVLMSNHYHLLISAPKHDLGTIMREFGRSTTQSLNLISGRTGHLFNGPYCWSQIQSPSYYANALKYVYRNPVKPKIVSQVENYPYSTLSGLVGNSALPFPIHIPTPELSGVSLLPDDIGSMVEWFNQPFPNETHEALAKGLRRKVFELPRHPKTGKIIELDPPPT